MSLRSTHNLTFTLLPVTIVVIAVATVVIGLLLVGSPGQERRRWADGVRVEDLSGIKHAVDNFYRERKRLPGNLDEITTGTPQLHKADPLTRQPYHFKKLGDKEYELGANFATDTSRDTEASTYRSEHVWHVDTTLPFWKHGCGVQYFRLKVEVMGSSKGMMASSAGSLVMSLDMER